MCKITLVILPVLLPITLFTLSTIGIRLCDIISFLTPNFYSPLCLGLWSSCHIWSLKVWRLHQGCNNVGLGTLPF